MITIVFKQKIFVVANIGRSDCYPTCVHLRGGRGGGDDDRGGRGRGGDDGACGWLVVVVVMTMMYAVLLFI